MQGWTTRLDDKARRQGWIDAAGELWQLRIGRRDRAAGSPLGDGALAFSSEVNTGSRHVNASNNIQRFGCASISTKRAPAWPAGCPLFVAGAAVQVGLDL
jgi:hypothetical protein